MEIIEDEILQTSFKCQIVSLLVSLNSFHLYIYIYISILLNACGMSFCEANWDLLFDSWFPLVHRQRISWELTL